MNLFNSYLIKLSMNLQIKKLKNPRNFMPTKFNDSTVKNEMTLWGAIVGHYLHPCKAFDRFYIIPCCKNCGNWAVIVYWYTKRKKTHFSFNLWAEKRENVIPTGETLNNYILWIHLFLWVTIYVYCGFICFYGSLITVIPDTCDNSYTVYM